MSELYEGVMTGLKEALAYAKGEPVDMVVHHIPTPDVKGIRERMGMSQGAFARAFGISVGTLRGWEQGRRNPQGPACTLLKVMDKEPEAVKRALAAAREDFRNHKVERVARNPELPHPAPAKPGKGARPAAKPEARP